MTSKGWTIKVYREGVLTRQVPLPAGETSVGRAADAALHLDDPRVSGHHCRILLEGDRMILEDLGSAHGTVVSGRPIRKITLEPDREFEVGPFICRVVSGSGEASPPGVAPASSPFPEGSPAIFSRLASLTARMVGITDLQTVLEVLLESLVDMLHARRGFVVLAHGGELSPVTAAVGPPAEEASDFSRTVCRKALDERRVVLLDLADVDARPEVIASLRAIRTGTVLAFPLLGSRGPAGVLYLDRKEPLPDELRHQSALWTEVSSIGGRALQAALDHRQLAHNQDRWRWVAEVRTTEPELEKDYPSPAMKAVVQMVERVAASDVTCLLLGESGTGKEVTARSLHNWSRRRDGPFVPINCGAIPHDLLESELFGHEKGAYTGATDRKLGRLEMAEGGTLLLDEIGELPKEMQVKLLRVLESRRIDRVGGRASIPWDARIIAATNKKLEEAVARGEFREDLYYRLNVVTISLPALRERREDISQLARLMLRDGNQRFPNKLYAVSPEAVAALEAYHWPGNIRELRNVIERAFVLERSDRLTVESLPFKSTAPAVKLAGAVQSVPQTLDHVLPLAEFIKNQEREYIALVLEQCGGNISKAAEVLQIARSSLYKKVSELGIKAPLEG